MYVYLFIFALLVVAGLMSWRGDSGGRSPSSLASAQVYDIRQHMTAKEHLALMGIAALFGLSIPLLGVSIALLFWLVGMQDSALTSMLAALLALPLLALLLWNLWAPRCFDSQRRFLASTEWARSQGIKPEDIRLFKWEERA